MTNESAVQYVNKTYPGYAFFDVPDWIKICGNARVAPPSDWTDPITGKTTHGARVKSKKVRKVRGPQHWGNHHNSKVVLEKRGDEVVRRFGSRDEAAKAIGKCGNTMGRWIQTKRIVKGLWYEYASEKNTPTRGR
jgi:hypothetical protein